MKVLIIKLGALGDMVMATSLIRRIQAAHQDAELQLLTSPAFAPLFADWPGLGLTHFPRKGLGNMLRALRWIRAQGFARVYDLQSNDRSGALCALSGIPERIGNHPRFPYTHHPAEGYHGQCHIFTRMNQVLASAGLEPAEPEPWLPIGRSGRTRVAAWLDRQGLVAQGYAVLHAAASPRWPSKCWPHFASLARRLEQSGIRCVWIGAGEDAVVNRELAASAGIDASDTFDIPELAELGRRARFALTSDSGPMHILSASGIPVYAFFGPTSWRRNHALGQERRVFCLEVDCSPCSLGVCPPEQGHRCLEGLAVESVFQRLVQDGLLA